MMLRASAALASALALASGRPASALVAERSAVTPVEKVVELLKRLGEQIQEEGKDEAVAYDKYACFCREQSMHKEYTLDKSGVLIGELQASVDELGAKIQQLDTEVTTLKADVTTEEGSGKLAADARHTAFAAYMKTRTPLEEGIEAIEEAISYLQNSKDGVVAKGKVASLIKTVHKLAAASGKNEAGVDVDQLLAHMRAARASAASGSASEGRHEDAEEDGSFLQQSPNAYEYKSNDIIQTLQGLLRTFKTELTESEETEVEDKHQHEMVEGARVNKVKALQASIGKKEELSAKKGAEKSDKEKLLSDETAAKQADQAFLDELTKTCEEKATAWDQRSKTRAAELTTITEAMRNLEGMGDVYNVNKKLVGFVTAKRHSAVIRLRAPPMFLQMVSSGARIQDASSLAALLEGKAHSLNSLFLAEAANAVRTNGGQEPVDHFVKVRGLIKDLISRLEADAASEATQKTFCDTEMAQSVAKRDQSQSEVEAKKAEIEKTQSEISKLGESIAELAETIASLQKALKEMTELRTEEKSSNEKTIVDAGQGAQAVQEAIVVLEKFYGGAGAFLQAGSGYTPPNADRTGKTVGDLAPEAGFSGEYSGKLAESKGILGLLQIIASDFDRTSSTTEAAEQTAQTEFETQKQTTEGDISQKEGMKSTQETDKTNKEDDLVTLKDEARDAENLHKSALDELVALKTSCVDASESYAERKRKREEEVAALKEALNILEDWNK